MAIRKRYATYEDLERVPETQVAELIDGDLIVSPRPGSAHARAATVLASDLVTGFDGPAGGWWFVVEPELHLDRDVVVPDLAGWRRDRLPLLPDVPAFTQAPDWLCEVVSPSTATLDRSRKMNVYAHATVGHVWLLEPRQQTLEVHRLEAGRWVVASRHAGDRPIHAEPFAARALDPPRWWLPRPPGDVPA